MVDNPNQHQNNGAAKDWLKLLNERKLVQEVENYPKFQSFILKKLLGFSVESLEGAASNKGDFTYTLKNGNTVRIEAKGQDANLFDWQSRSKGEHSTPIKQLWDNMGTNENIRYGVCTNYHNFVLIIRDIGRERLHHFKFMDFQILGETNFNKTKRAYWCFWCALTGDGLSPKTTKRHT